MHEEGIHFEDFSEVAEKVRHENTPGDITEQHERPIDEYFFVADPAAEQAEGEDHCISGEQFAAKKDNEDERDCGVSIMCYLWHGWIQCAETRVETTPDDDGEEAACCYKDA
ncbi:hypothetical protein O9G_004701 [Rozella allomycis CSF55]|uniref:Uncharacterized protein n=1 Tax=Rozella allomycis (strain CSF55) TaxID=988480 RepID=A0A075AY78_ROZAC|nr:hypothetical protein O9G_004701 [Rozella allomycis CSF55]|eukprot:EPZ35222.1 hypothetical protein O9G_004701 [Rozella allomycis CSF55]